VTVSIIFYDYLEHVGASTWMVVLAQSAVSEMSMGSCAIVMVADAPRFAFACIEGRGGRLEG